MTTGNAHNEEAAVAFESRRRGVQNQKPIEIAQLLRVAVEGASSKKS